jgi:hypothetical protein
VRRTVLIEYVAAKLLKMADLAPGSNSGQRKFILADELPGGNFS